MAQNLPRRRRPASGSGATEFTRRRGMATAASAPWLVPNAVFGAAAAWMLQQRMANELSDFCETAGD